jgi:uncharacterized protein (TIGR00730 family)
MVDKVITIFGSSRPDEKDEEYKLAYEVGKCLATSGFTICNGGYGGIMEASARGAKDAAGKTIGITFKNSFKRTANKWIDEEVFQRSLVERLLKLVELGDAYVVLKGGTGTLLELAAIWEFINKKLLKEKPIVIIGDFWNSVVDTLREELLWEGAGDCTKFIYRTSSPEECAAFLKTKLVS